PAGDSRSRAGAGRCRRPPRRSDRRRSRSPGRAGWAGLLRCAAIEPFDLERLQDLVEALLEAGRLDRVRPHHDRILVVVGVVTAAATNDLEAELFIKADGDIVGRAYLERQPARPELIRPLDQGRHEGMAVTLALPIRTHPDGG